MKKILNNYLLIVIIFISLFLYLNISIKDLRKNTDKTISIEVRDINNSSYSFNLNLGSTFKDLLKVLDDNSVEYGKTYNYSLNLPLYNNQIISFYKSNKDTNKLVSINSASIKELMTLPGIGEKTAIKIIEYRNNNGGFKYLDEIKNVSGIGDKKYERIKELITI